MQTEHPFAPYIRILGKGKKGSRGLTVEEAYESMTMVLNNDITAEQLGAFLMLLRVKEETPEEVAGFVKAIRTYVGFGESIGADLDWSSYAGKRRHSPWYVLSALLLAENGVKICMHGAEGHTPGRMYTSEVLEPLGVKICHDLEQAKLNIQEINFCYLPLQAINQRLKDIIELRPFLGLRSPIHTVGRMMNPLNAPHCIQAIFHGGYQRVHQEAAKIMGLASIAVFKGEAGEVERNPDTECTVSYAIAGELSEEIWPPLFKRRHRKEKQLDSARLTSIWRAEENDEYADAAIIGTAAIALRLIGKAMNPAEAIGLAAGMWEQRDKNKY